MIAEQVIVAAGPWIAGLIPNLGRHLTVTRQAVGWFTPARPETVRYGEFPVFIVEGRRGLIYGFPDFEGRGVKAARHDHGRIVGRHEDHRVGPLRQGLADQHLLLADIVGRLRHVVDGPRAGLGGDPVGRQPGGGIGRIDPVLGENGERGSMDHADILEAFRPRRVHCRLIMLRSRRRRYCRPPSGDQKCSLQ